MNPERMKSIDPRSIDRSSLRRREDVRLDSSASQRERVRQLFGQINPYCYLDGKTVVISRFAETDTSIEDCFRSYLAGA